MSESDSEIKFHSRTVLCLVPFAGSLRLHGSTGSAFLAPLGSWNIKKCLNADCGLMWLDPDACEERYWGRPIKVTIRTRPNPLRHYNDPLNRTLIFLKERYWANKYGYRRDRFSNISQFLGKFALIFRLFTEVKPTQMSDALNRSLGGGFLMSVVVPKDWLLSMRHLGWDVEGLDFDENAVRAAEQRGLHVHSGSLEDQCYPDNSFDAITLSHVIEHVFRDLIHTVRECFRILKTGGKLVLLTPNNTSMSHHIFKASWRGLEPPRHLHIFSLRSLSGLFARSGFSIYSTRPFIVTSVIYDSIVT